jgi:hypothetical protein
MFEDELREKTVLPALVSKKYEGEIKPGGSTVRVSQINEPSATTKVVGAGHETFATTTLATQYVEIAANRVISAAFEFDDLIALQSQIGQQDSSIRAAMLHAVEKNLNAYLYSLVAPATTVSGVTDFNASQIINLRKLAAQKFWPDDSNWWLLVDPSYQADLFAANTLVSSDYVPDAPTVGGKMVTKRFGFNIVEDNSAGMADVSPTSATSDLALAFHPSFMHLVMGQPEFKVSDSHPNSTFGYKISVRLICGAALSNDGDQKHVSVYNV